MLAVEMTREKRALAFIYPPQADLVQPPNAADAPRDARRRAADLASLAGRDCDEWNLDWVNVPFAIR